MAGGNQDPLYIFIGMGSKEECCFLKKKCVMLDHWWQGLLLLRFLPFHQVSQLGSRDMFCVADHVTPWPAALAPASARAASQHWRIQISTTGAADLTGKQQVGWSTKVRTRTSGPACCCQGGTAWTCHGFQLSLPRGTEHTSEPPAKKEQLRVST